MLPWFVLLVGAGVCAIGLRPVTDAWLQRFASRFGVPLDDESRGPLVAALTRSRQWRVAGSAVGLSASAVVIVAVQTATDTSTAGSGSLRTLLLMTAPLIGWLVGDLTGEVALWHRPMTVGSLVTLGLAWAVCHSTPWTVADHADVRLPQP